MTNKEIKFTIVDQVMIFITSIFLFIHVKQLFASPQFVFNAILGIWISMSVFDLYAKWRAKR